MGYRISDLMSKSLFRVRSPEPVGVGPIGLNALAHFTHRDKRESLA